VSEDEHDHFMRNATCSGVIFPTADEVEKYNREVEHQKFRRKTRGKSRKNLFGR